MFQCIGKGQLYARFFGAGLHKFQLGLAATLSFLRTWGSSAGTAGFHPAEI